MTAALTKIPLLRHIPFQTRLWIFGFPICLACLWIHFSLNAVSLVLLLIIMAGYTVSCLRKPPSLQWESEFLWITGGTHGVGKALVEAVMTKSKGSAQILVLDCELPASTWLHSFRGHVQFESVDLATVVACPEKIQEWIEKYGAPSVLVNNAGTMVGKYLTHLSTEELLRVLHVNLVAPILLTRAVLPSMLKNNAGHVIHVASACGLVGLAWLTDYCASKFGLMGFHEALRQELQNTNVKTSILCPAQIDTKLFRCTQPKYPLLTPVLSSSHVAHEILTLIENNKSEDLWIPLFVYTSILVRAAPLWLNDWAHRFIGANELHPLQKAPY